MSTRGAIARWTNTDTGEWAGRYHHWDSYPSGLGASLYQLVKAKTLGDLATTVSVLIDEHPAGWSTINGADWGEPSGYEDSGKDLCKECGRQNWEHYAQQYNTPALRQCLENILSTLPFAKAERIRAREEFVLWHSFAHDFEQRRPPQCYCHGDRREESWDITQRNAAGSGVEWVYVFDLELRTMAVLEATVGDQHSVGMFGAGNPDASWCERAVVYLDHLEPDWKTLES